jgi:hypothetical protein
MRSSPTRIKLFFAMQKILVTPWFNRNFPRRGGSDAFACALHKIGADDALDGEALSR